jgi:hypothetical protein
MPPTDYAHLAGTSLPEGSFTITAAENARVAELAGDVPAGDGSAHPSYSYIATQRGIGMSVEALLSLVDFRIADGPMLGSCGVSFTTPLRVGVAYRVTGEIVQVDRKHGRSGTFDVLRFRERLIAPRGAEAAAVTNVFILPRRELRET